jgi:hypothetical protein
VIANIEIYKISVSVSFVSEDQISQPPVGQIVTK